jgi:hypothetical protein
MILSFSISTAAVILLMQQASGDTLTPREIAHILVETSQHHVQTNTHVNGAGLRVHEKVYF